MDSAAQKKINKSYIDNNLNQIFEPMVTKLFRENPSDHIKYMYDYLKSHHGNRPSLNASARDELDFLRELYSSAAKKQGIQHEHSDDEHSSSDEEDGEFVEELPQAKVRQSTKPRVSVSAEVFGRWNKKEDFKAPYYEKSDEVYNAVKTRLEQAFMFSALNPEELRIVLGAMQGVSKKAGEVIITEGEDGDNLYVVESGTLSCTKVFDAEKGPTFLKEYNPGEAFGELALLYNAPRAATITSKTDSQLWALDRKTFGHIVKDAAQRKRDKYEEFLSKVPILQSMESYERSKLADAIKDNWYKKGDLIIQEGDAGNTFFMVMKGTAIATKSIEKGKPPVQVMAYKEGDYFGERALLKNEPRAANIEVTSDEIQVVSLERASFKRLLGPLDQILARNMENYQKFQ